MSTKNLTQDLILWICQVLNLLWFVAYVVRYTQIYSFVVIPFYINYQGIHVYLEEGG